MQELNLGSTWDFSWEATTLTAAALCWQVEWPVQPNIMAATQDSSFLLSTKKHMIYFISCANSVIVLLILKHSDTGPGKWLLPNS